MTQITALDYVVMAIYFAVVLGIGWALRRKMRTSNDFLLSGRSLPPWVTGLAFLSANLGAQEVVLAGVDAVGDAVEDGGAIAGRTLAPRTLARFSGGGDGVVAPQPRELPRMHTADGGMPAIQRVHVLRQRAVVALLLRVMVPHVLLQVI